jgi:hypothetical protein
MATGLGALDTNCRASPRVVVEVEVVVAPRLDQRDRQADEGDGGGVDHRARMGSLGQLDQV